MHSMDNRIEKLIRYHSNPNLCWYQLVISRWQKWFNEFSHSS